MLAEIFKQLTKAIPNNKQLSMEDLKPLNVPYIYQYELYQPAWPPPTRIGYYIVAGKKYRYCNPLEWHHNIQATDPAGHGSETDGFMSIESIYANIGNSRKQCVLWNLIRKPVLLSQTILDDLLTSKVTDYGQQMCDAGLESKSLYIYDPESKQYKRILLSCDRDQVLVNQSNYAANVIEAFERS